ncbi:MAG: thioether cross-link-forming SCIFF peptide maturase [Syntrophomonas sp.]
MRSLANYDFAANIHLYRYKELNILLDVNSGAIHILDDLACQLVEAIIAQQGNVEKARNDVTSKNPGYAEDEIDRLIQELEAAMEAESLFTEGQVLEVNLSNLHIKAICLNVAHACNMKCRYCFAGQGEFGRPPALMSLATARQALDFLLEQSGAIQNLEVDFFGGEPLLVLPMLQELLPYARQREEETGKKFSFTLTTNALLLDDEVIDFVIANEIGVILSLDGRKEVNDRHRILNNGAGSYDLILPRIKKMVERNPVSYYVRGTFSRQNLDFARDLEHLVELGFDCVSLEPAVGPENGFAIQESDLPQVLEEYERLTELLLNYHRQGRHIHFFHYNLNLQKGPCLAKRSTGCGAGIEYLVITPEGDIYPCHQFVGEDDFYMGNLQKGQVDRKIRSKFESNQLKNKDCKHCWVRYFCGGGCHAQAYRQHGKISIPHYPSCAMHMKRIEGAIYLDLRKDMDNRQNF